MKIVIFLLILFSKSIGQENDLFNKKFEEYQLSSKKYITNQNGEILIKVNIWGNVDNPGSHLVYDGIDFASLLSIVGGPTEEANLNRVRLYRETPDENGQLKYNIDLNSFIRNGDRSSFIEIKPNDTIIIPRKISALVLKQIGTLNTIFSLIMIFLQLTIVANN
tara:strand:- start:2129 stop:2620 length:492 start_codon:yes stop_codon:yes gene_type:complete